MFKRVFTPEEMAQMGREALDNWDFDVLLDEGESPEYVQRYKDALDFDAAYAASMWADDDGEINLDQAYSDVWDMLDEFAKSTAGSI